MAKDGLQSSDLFGIHVGNTSACLASFKDGKIQVIANDTGDRITPAVVAMNGSEKIVGCCAKAAVIRNKTSTIVCNKRLLNDNLDEETLADIEVKTPYKIIRGESEVKYELTYNKNKFNVSAESVAAAIFCKLHQIASSSVNSDSVMKTIICCPLNFSESSCRTMIRAAEESGFDVLQVISEPSATALAYEVGIKNPGEDSLCLVYRVGGVSLDASLIDVHHGLYSIHHSVHCTDLGGDQFTILLAEYLAEEFKRKYKIDPTESRRSFEKLRCAAENCKHILSSLETAHCLIESLCEGVDFSYNITRARFESLITPSIPKYIDPIKEMIQDANIESERIQKVLVSGGSLKIPKLLKTLRDTFPHAEVFNNLNPDEVIAIGAARQASYVFRINNIESVQHLSHEFRAVSETIYVKGSLIKDYECVIRKKTPVPVNVKKTFHVEPDQDISFEIFEMISGESTVRRILATLTLSPVHSSTELSLDINVNSCGAFSVVLGDSSGEKTVCVNLDPPLE